jgi:hypothetical protein
MRNKIGKKGKKYENYHVATGDFDNDPVTPDNVLLLNELNQILAYDGYSIELKPDQDLFEKTL